MPSIIGVNRFDPTNIADVVSVNYFIVTSRKQKFGVNFEKLAEIFDYANDIFNLLIVSDKRKAVVMTAGHIMAGIAYWQPFDDGNKTTALTVTRRFLRDNGYLLPVRGKTQKDSIYDLMNKTILKFETDKTIYSEVQEYLDKNVISLA